MDAFRMIEAPSGRSGSAFCTVKSRPFTLMLKDRVIELLGNGAERGELRDSGIGEHNIELALLPLDLCEETIQIAKVRHVPLYASYISSNLLCRRSQLLLTTARYEDVRAFVHKLLRRGKANATIATSNECNSSFKFVHIFLSSYQRMSDCEDDSAEGAVLNQVTQSIGRFGQREGLSHDRFDRAGLKQRDDSIPGVNPGRLRLREQYEALDAGLLPDQVCDVNGCLAAPRIPQCCEASARRKRSERLAQDFTADPVNDNVSAVTAGNTTHAITQLLGRHIHDLIESERLRLLGFRMIGRA